MIRATPEPPRRRGLALTLLVALACLAPPATADVSPGRALPGRGIMPVDGPVVATFEPPDAERPWASHAGVDLGVTPGTPVVAALPGRVSHAGPVFGRVFVTVSHGSLLRTTYGEFGEIAVRRGQAVVAGQLLGTLGTVVDHLDWSLRIGPPTSSTYLDPLLLLVRWRPRLVIGAPARMQPR